MSVALKKLLEKNRNKKQPFTSDAYGKMPIPSKLPKEKPLKGNGKEAEQCFIMVPDVHAYERDIKAFNLFMKAVPIINQMYNVTKVVQLGDLLEGGEFSTHPVRSVYESVPEYSEELEWAIDEFWKPLMKTCPNANFYALFGNHEDRINKKLADRLGANKLSQSVYEQYCPRTLYEDMGIHVTPYGADETKNGMLEIFPKLLCIHGWTFQKHAARGHIDIISGSYSIIFGHTHRFQVDYKRNPITNAFIGSWNFGGLCRVNFKYEKGKPNDHVLGFGIVLTHKDSFFIIPMPINITSTGRKLLLPDGRVLQN
jgi:predicted phosphodiesterase